jgi:hypothetical protein
MGMDRNHPRKIGIGLDRARINSFDARTKHHSIERADLLQLAAASDVVQVKTRAPPSGHAEPGCWNISQVSRTLSKIWHTVRTQTLISKHQAVKLLQQIPAIGPIRAALLVALLQTPHRFRTKPQLWAYSGFALETHDSGEYRMVRGKVRRNRERLTVLGRNDNHNHDLKNLFKGAALSASTRPGPLYDFYVGLLQKGMRPTMARLTLARKIATITLTMRKKGVDFDAQQLNRQAA